MNSYLKILAGCHKFCLMHLKKKRISSTTPVASGGNSYSQNVCVFVGRVRALGLENENRFVCFGWRIFFLLFVSDGHLLFLLVAKKERPPFLFLSVTQKVNVVFSFIF